MIDLDKLEAQLPEGDVGTVRVGVAGMREIIAELRAARGKDVIATSKPSWWARLRGR